MILTEEDTALLAPYFWDTDIHAVDIKKNRRFIIERLLMFGRPGQVQWIIRHYSKKDIAEVIKRSKSIDKRTASYWAVHFGIDRKEIVCFNRQLMNPFFY
jgi:hypothetical protein